MSVPSPAFLALPFQPEFTKAELESSRIRIADLKTINAEWNIPSPSRPGRKASYYKAIIDHPDNVDPAFVAAFGIQQLPLPPYNKNMLKHLRNNELRSIQTWWDLPQDETTVTRRCLINVILAHLHSSFDFWDADYPHALESDELESVDHDSDTEPHVRPSILMDSGNDYNIRRSNNNVTFDMSENSAERTELTENSVERNELKENSTERVHELDGSAGNSTHGVPVYGLQTTEQASTSTSPPSQVPRYSGHRYNGSGNVSTGSGNNYTNVRDLIGDLNNYKEYNKLKVTITGSQDENLPNEITDI